MKIKFLLMIKKLLIENGSFLKNVVILLLLSRLFEIETNGKYLILEVLAAIFAIFGQLEVLLEKITK